MINNMLKKLNSINFYRNYEEINRKLTKIDFFNKNESKLQFLAIKTIFLNLTHQNQSNNTHIHHWKSKYQKLIFHLF